MTKYDDAIAASNKTISGDKLFNSFESKINEFQNGYTAQDKSIAKKLTDIYDNITSKHGTDNIDASTLVDVKRGLQKSIAERQFTIPADEAGANKQAFDIVKNLLDETTDGQTKTLGTQLRKMMPLRDILVERSRNSPGYSLGQGLSDIKNLGIGTVAGGPVGGFGLMVLNKLRGTSAGQLLESRLQRAIGVGIQDLNNPQILQRFGPAIDTFVINTLRNQTIDGATQAPTPSPEATPQPQLQGNVNMSKLSPVAGANVGDPMDPIRRQKQALIDKQRYRPKTLA